MIRHRPLRVVLTAVLAAFIILPAVYARGDGPRPGLRFDAIGAQGAIDGKAGRSRVTSFARQPLVPGIAHYRFDLRVGSGPFDTIRLHRVVAEHAPYRPKSSPRAILLAHGDLFPFVPTFLNSSLVPEIPNDHSLAAFLATRGIDVWGIDFRWTLVPADTEDVSFMADWGMGTDVDDLDVALVAARLIRLATGSGLGRIHLGGFSRGGQTAYAYLDAESQRPRFWRNARGFVAFDIPFKTDDEDLRQRACARAAEAQGRIDGGQPASSARFIALLGQLAFDDPDGISPLLPPFTNGQLMLTIGVDADPDLSPTFHRVGGRFDPDTLDTELFFSPDRAWFAHNAETAAFEPWRVVLDGETVFCDEVDSSFDDHLADITVPVLYVGAAGGFGAAGVFSTSLLGSTDTSALIIQTLSPELAGEDFGHVDLFLGDDADDLVWRPIAEWIEAR